MREKERKHSHENKLEEDKLFLKSRYTAKCSCDCDGE